MATILSSPHYNSVIAQSTGAGARIGRWVMPPGIPDRCYFCIEKAPGMVPRQRAATGYIANDYDYDVKVEMRVGTCDHCHPERPTDGRAVKMLGRFELELRRWHVDHPGQDMSYADLAEIYEALSFFAPLLRHGLSRTNSHAGWLVRIINAAGERARAATQTLEVQPA